MKALRNKSLMSLIYVALLSIPLVSILSRVIYVQANKNAYQSYSDRYVETTQLVSNSSQFVEGQDLIATYHVKENESTTYGAYIKYNSISIDWTDYGFDEYTYTEFRLFNTGLIQLKDTNGVQYNRPNVWGDTLKSFTFNFNSFTNDFTLNGNVNYFALFYQQDKLDNVFEYSVSKLVDENNFGKLNFFTWFADLLLDDAQMNMTYVRFANWYLCYALLISLMQILFLVLMWFVNFSRKLLDRGMNYDW